MSHLNINGVDKPLDHIKIKAIIKGLSEPLCGIGTYKDTLDLSTGVLTRYVKKLVLTGEEKWSTHTAASGSRFSVPVANAKQSDLGTVASICTHFPLTVAGGTYSNDYTYTFNDAERLYVRMNATATLNGFKQWLADQYASGTPVTVLYIPETPETEQITVPSHLTGTIEGYLTQTGTPTPSNPIYPTANGEEESGGTYSIDTGEYIEAWEARDKNDHLLWGRADTFTGTNSISARCYGLPVKSWEIDGNSQQSGTPAPDDPIMPEFVGERTGNLFDITSTPTTYNCSVSVNDGILTQTSSGIYARSAWKIDNLVIGAEYVVSITANNPNSCSFRINVMSSDDTTQIVTSSTFTDSRSISLAFTATQTSHYIRIYSNTLGTTSTSAITFTSIMLNAGDIAKPYEPYGYKLPITSAGQTQTVYIGQVSTTRRVKKLVFTGNEDWTIISDIYYSLSIERPYMPDRNDLLSTHFFVGNYSGAVSIGQIRGAGSPSASIIINYDNGTIGVDGFKQWLADQYASGTPVTVWYVVSVPETAIVNEPLCKISTYADTLTSDQAGITIPTTDGSTTISVDTTLAPSKFELKLHAKPIHYGFKIDKSISDPSNAVIYTHDAVTMTPAGMDFTNGVFDYGSWENVWFIKSARPVMLNFDGTEAYDLDPNDYSKKLDGTPSDIADSTKNTNAMIAFPTVWIKRTDDASYNYIEISDQQLDSDFHAYAHEDANGVVKPYIYLPIYKGSMVDGKLRSISGVKPQSNTTAQQEVDAASALGTGWQIWDYTSKEMLCDLLTLISKSLDTQGKFGQGHSTGGSSASDFLDCGTLNNKGKFFGYSATTSQVKCFGMEALWAERWDRELGLILDGGIYKIKEHPTYNLTGEGYTAISTSVAQSPTSNDYIKTEISTQYGSLPTVVGGTESTYYCDYFYQSQTNIRVSIRGGSCGNGANDGLRCVSVNGIVTASAWFIGASPVYK